MGPVSCGAEQSCHLLATPYAQEVSLMARSQGSGCGWVCEGLGLRGGLGSKLLEGWRGEG